MQKTTFATPPTPPPPTSPPAPAPKISRKTLIALSVIVIIVVATVAGVLLATRSGGGGGGGTGGSIAEASSLKFDADITVSGTSMTYTYSAKNIGTSSPMLRMEGTGPQGSFIYIINGVQKEAWMYQSGSWTNLTGYFQSYWSQWNSSFTEMKNTLSHWSGSGDYTYTDPSTGGSVRIYNIAVNPSLPDSLFEHS
jgi:hypothetical protein